MPDKPHLHSDESDIPTAIWDQAVAEIDGEHGYSVEFSSDPEGHREGYRQRAEQIAANVGLRMPDQRMSERGKTEPRWQRWCGICFAWREERKGRCVVCGNAHMRGSALPLEATHAA